MLHTSQMLIRVLEHTVLEAPITVQSECSPVLERDRRPGFSKVFFNLTRPSSPEICSLWVTPAQRAKVPTVIGMANAQYTEKFSG